VYGLSAALAVMARRPSDIVNIAYAQSARKALAPALREAARRRVPYNEFGDDELAQMAGATHHEGVCLLVRARPAPGLDDMVRAATPQGLLLALDGVDNPHNVGAVLRSAAFFGASGMIVADAARKALPASAVRIAEGGAEYVRVWHVPELAPVLRTLRDHAFSIVGADNRAGVLLDALQWPARAVLVLGAERVGLTPAVRGACHVVTRIEGTGALDSLNVAVAAGVLLASHARAMRGTGAPRS
jgi:TrmH RNA methyltransferase